MTAMEKMRARLLEIADEREALSREYDEIAAAMVVVERFTDDGTVTQLRPLPLRPREPAVPPPGPPLAEGEEIDADDLTKGQQALLRIIFGTHPESIRPMDWMHASAEETIDAFNTKVTKLGGMGLIAVSPGGAWYLTARGVIVAASLHAAAA